MSSVSFCSFYEYQLLKRIKFCGYHHMVHNLEINWCHLHCRRQKTRISSQSASQSARWFDWQPHKCKQAHMKKSSFQICSYHVYWNFYVSPPENFSLASQWHSTIISVKLADFVPPNILSAKFGFSCPSISFSFMDDFPPATTIEAAVTSKCTDTYKLSPQSGQ